MTKEKKELSYKTKGRGKTVKYATKERIAKINEKNIKAYDQYLRSSTIKNKDVIGTTYKTYESYFRIFLCFIAEKWDNFYILDEEFLDENMVDVMEDYMGFLQDELHNAKKSINTKVSAVSSFYQWAAKRRKITHHPFADRLDRMQGAQDEKIISEYFLTKEQVHEIEAELSLANQSGSDYDKLDQVLWHIAYDSACRIGALHGLTVSSLDLDGNCFRDIREKRGKIVDIPFTDETKQIILEYLDVRKKMDVDCDGFFYVFSDGQWKTMSKQSIYARVKKIGYIVGVGDFRPHCIRKTRINLVAKLDINKAKTLANHESLDTTSRFYTEKAKQTDTLAAILKLEEKAEKKEDKDKEEEEE